MKKSLFIILSLLVVAVTAITAVFFYITRPLAAPSQQVALQKTEGSSGSTMLLQIDPSDSTATFEIFEVLSGQDKTVIGTTDQVSGTVQLDTEQPSNSTVSEIRINARTFVTDSDRRNAAIGRVILKSEEAENEYITFLPKKISGLPDTGERLLPYTFFITGDLTISGITTETVFETKARMREDGSIEGSALGSVARSDYNLVIPTLPFVADVGEDVTLKLDFVLR